MRANEQEFLERLRTTFRVEAEEHLQVIATALLEIEQATPEAQRQIIDRAFRAAHSLKGAARAVDYTDIESECQALEDTFSAWQHQRATPSAATFDVLHRRVNAISAVIGLPAAQQPLRAAPEAQTRPRAGVAEPAAPVARSEDPPPTAGETVRIPAAKLDARVIEAEEMLTAKLASRQHASDLRALTTRFESWKKEYLTVESEARLLRRSLERSSGDGASRGLLRVLDFLDWNQDYFRSLQETTGVLLRNAELDSHVVDRLVDDLLESSKKLLLLPFGTIAAPFPKLVRDLGRDLAKEAELRIRGEDVEVDKRVLEEIKDPLVHLLRNAMDHGIEPPDERQQAGKPRRGTVTVAASPMDGNTVQVVVMDDGAGVDPERVRAAAVRQGIVSSEQARDLTDADAPRLIFEADISTTTNVTHLSGRGLGLAIVRDKVEKLGGTVSLESRRGQGTRFTLTLPSTLATFRGVLVRAAGRLFVVPTYLVDRVVRLPAADIRTVENRETVALAGRAVAVVRLSDVLELPAEQAEDESPGSLLALVLGSNDQRIAFVVEAVLDEQEVLVKPLRPPLSRVRNISGVTIHASGQVVPILNVTDLLKSAKKIGNSAVRGAAVAREPRAAAKLVLVAEDSITSRMLIKGILESAGFHVKTAADGLDAFALLRGERFDLVVSDVEMPRLNGFDLAARIRADRRLAELPIVLVTALDTPEDRARGIDVGADAYIVKGSFDQSNLLEAVRRLV